MRKPKNYISETELRERYIDKKQNAIQIASDIGVHSSTIYKLLNDFGINTRNRKDAAINGAKKPTKEELYQMYEVDRMSAMQIAKKIEVSDTSIYNWLKECGIQRSSSKTKLKGAKKSTEDELYQMYEIEKLDIRQISEKTKFSSASIHRWLNDAGIMLRASSEMHKKEFPSYECLYRMYVTEHMSTIKIANEYNVGYSTVSYWLHKHMIKIRSASENMSGENHHNWQGGITHENTKFRHSLEYMKWRISVFERDDYTCQECEERGVFLNAHHILPYSDWKDPRFALNINNGITLCKDCHYGIRGKEYEFFNKYFDIANGVGKYKGE